MILIDATPKVFFLILIQAYFTNVNIYIQISIECFQLLWVTKLLRT